MTHHFPSAKAWQTTPDRKSLLAPLTLSEATNAPGDATTIILEERQSAQSMDGFGAALTDSSAYLISRLPPTQRAALLHDLFDSKSGIGLSILRIPMGASDFAVNGSYTYHDLPPNVQDPDLSRFSIAHDKSYILPVLREIQKINPRLKIMASPWSAPAWMKTNKSLNGGWLDWPAYPAFARYIVKFVQAYQAEGIPIWALSVQNEPRHESNTYPSMRMEPNDQARFIKDYLGTALSNANLKPKIFAWDHNWDGVDFPLGVLSDAGARRFISGVAWHGYGGTPEAQKRVTSAFPEMEMHFTESSGGEWATDFGGNLQWDMENLIGGSIRYGSRSVLKWNLVLDEKHGPQNGGCTNCRGVVTIHSQTGEVTHNEEYFTLGHASKFVRPGAKYLITPDIANLPSAAFHNTDGTAIWVGCNAQKTPRPLVLRRGNHSIGALLPPGALVTISL